MLGLAKLQPLDEPAQVPQAARRGWNIRHRLALIGGIVCLAGLAGVAGLWLISPQVERRLAAFPGAGDGVCGTCCGEGIANPPDSV